MTNVEHATKDASIPHVIRIDQDQVRSHVEEVVRSTVEETLNALLDAEADELCGAQRSGSTGFASVNGRRGDTTQCATMAGT